MMKRVPVVKNNDAVRNAWRAYNAAKDQAARDQAADAVKKAWQAMHSPYVRPQPPR